MKGFAKTLQDNIKLIKNYEIASIFFTEIKKEIIVSEKIYGSVDADQLKNYYQYSSKSEANFKYSRHRYADTIQFLIHNIKKDYKVLDAGCGVGSESILCSLLGGRITGIDISSRLDVAKKRISYYEDRYNATLNIDFLQKSVFDHSGKYDLIWVNEAISHIHPAERFFQIAYKNLRKNGILLISDGNNLNPKIFINAKISQKRRGGMIYTKKDLNTGKLIPYAHERKFSVFEIRNISSKLFKFEKLYYIGYLPFLIFNKFPKFSRFIEDEVVKKIVLIKILAGGYILKLIKKSD